MMLANENKRNMPITSQIVVTTGAEKLSGSNPCLKVIRATTNPTTMTHKIVVIPERKIINHIVNVGNVLKPNNVAMKLERSASNEKPKDEDKRRPTTDPHKFSDFNMLLSVLPVYNSVVTLEARTAAISPL